MIDVTIRDYSETFRFYGRSPRRYIISCTYNDVDLEPEIGEFHKTQDDQWVLMSEGIPMAVIRKSEQKYEQNVPSSDKDDWDRVLGTYNETIFLDYLKKCYEKL